MADLIHGVIASEPWFDEQTCPPSVILSCVGRLYNNRFAISDYDNTELAVGLYPLAHLINHRCAPNATFVFDGLRMSLRSIAAIHKNEEITVQLRSHSPVDQLRRSRQAELCPEPVPIGRLRDL